MTQPPAVSDTTPPITRGELLPCPFCGGQGEMTYFCRMVTTEPAGHLIECISCGASSEHIEITGEMPDRVEHAKGKAIAAWNTRTPPVEGVGSFRPSAFIPTEPVTAAGSGSGEGENPMLFWAFRYVLGRSTYAVSEVASAIIEGPVSEATQERMIAEIDKALATDRAGMEIDAAEWRAVRRALAGDEGEAGVNHD